MFEKLNFILNCIHNVKIKIHFRNEDNSFLPLCDCFMRKYLIYAYRTELWITRIKTFDLKTEIFILHLCYQYFQRAL